MSRIYSMWLSMDEPAKSSLARIITQLCSEYNAVPFEPHLTLISGKFDDFNDLVIQIDQFFEDFSPLVLSIQKINFSEDFFKTLFLQFESSNQLNSLYQRAKSTLTKTRSKVFFPHISLLYKNMHIKEKEKLSQSITLTLTQVCLNQIKIVTPKKNDTDWYDIENWHVIYKSSIKRSI